MIIPQYFSLTSYFLYEIKNSNVNTVFEIDNFETEEIAKIVKRINLIQIKNKLDEITR